MFFQQAPELQQHGGVRRRFVRQIDTDKATNGLAVVDRIFYSFVRQAEALLGNVHAQHTFQANRWAATAIALRVVGQDRSHQRRSRRGGLDFGQEAVAPRQLLLAGVLGIGKARLHHRISQGRKRYCDSSPGAGDTGAPIISALP